MNFSVERTDQFVLVQLVHLYLKHVVLAFVAPVIGEQCTFACPDDRFRPAVQA